MADRAPSGEVWPVLLAGGTGTRLWPLSRGLFPKQFMPLVSSATMFQETARRLSGPRFARPLVVCNDAHRFIAAEQLRAAGIDPEAIILEPVGRNTGPAAAVAALRLVERDPEALLLLAPADHVVTDGDAFDSAIDVALPAARTGRLVTFGVVPSRPETGYGYLLRGAPLDGVTGCFALDEFTEKPDAEMAASYLESGRHFWNSGIFLMRAGTYLAELDRHAPEVLAAARASLEGGTEDLDFFRLDAEALSGAPDLSVDYAVMEETDRGAVVPVEMGWSDVGSWAALWEIGDKDGAGNVIRGDVVAHGVGDAYLRTEKPLLAVLGLNDVVVVATDDAVLVADKAAAQDVKAVVEALNADDRSEPLTHTTVFRPWGRFQTVDAGNRFQVKRITVNPGGRLSLQKHARRAEHWVVVEGVATVTRDAETFELRANESVYIPIGAAHRLENRTGEPLHLVEVQSGEYLGEDDIVRLEDAYGRR